MAKKRKSNRKFNPSRPHKRRKSSPPQLYTASTELIILRILYHSHSGMTLPELSGTKGVKKFEAKTIQQALEKLLYEKLVRKSSKGAFHLHSAAQLYTGKLIQNVKGFGFVVPTGVCKKSPLLESDIFIPPTKMSGAMHGDTVLVACFASRRGRRSEGLIVDILQKRSPSLCGVVTTTGKEYLVTPDDTRFPFKISLPSEREYSLKQGDAVLVEYFRTEKLSRTLSGRLLQRLGDSNEIDTQMEMVINSHELPHVFEAEVVEAAENLEDNFPLSPDRMDLRETQHVTIDGATAKDFDDAICVIKNRKGFRLYVSIADVSHYVTPGSAIDSSAYERGTSIYFPGRVIPMLPERLSNNICSLLPNEDRYTVSAILDFDRSGKLLKKSFARSIIHSHKRFTYDTVKKILIDKDPTVRREHKPYLTPLKWAGELASALQARRKKRGSIDFNLTEPYFHLNEKSEIISITKAERSFAHQIIEEFMLAANEAVASLFIEKSIPAIFRTHEEPDQEKLEEFLNFINSLGIPLKPFENEATWFSDTLHRFRDTKYEYIVNNLLLRCLKQAQYTASNHGHFGLAAPAYMHFTSPIRRYPDLIAHRLLLQLCAQSSSKAKKAEIEKSYKEAGSYLSKRERVAAAAERDMNDRLKLSFMGDKVGESFSAIISGVSENSMYVELDQLCISGVVPVELLTDDYYLFDRKQYRLFGEITAKTYQIGDSVTVTLLSIDKMKKRLTFGIHREE